MRSWMYLWHLTSRLRKITKHKSHLQLSVFCLNRTKFTHSTGNYFFYGQHSTGNEFFNGQSRLILIWSTKKNVMKDKSFNVPSALDIAPQKNHKTQISSSIVCFFLNRTKIAHSTGNYFFYGQWRWILIWSTNENVMKDKSLNVHATLDIAPQKNLTKNKSHLQSSVFWLESNQNYPFNWKWLILLSIQVDFDLKQK